MYSIFSSNFYLHLNLVLRWQFQSYYLSFGRRRQQNSFKVCSLFYQLLIKLLLFIHFSYVSCPSLLIGATVSIAAPLFGWKMLHHFHILELRQESICWNVGNTYKSPRISFPQILNSWVDRPVLSLRYLLQGL